MEASQAYTSRSGSPYAAGLVAYVTIGTARSVTPGKSSLGNSRKARMLHDADLPRATAGPA